ncbi:hypothetical protein B0A55_06798 [Friedmanniomyces simplex]|uniref:Uncharacterized protein n=1 Tax=Friedmanniomyces simplex TaxID=329884 RepID=A0A4V5NFN9_9PEZI|nr:hypothetical protein B0A55_06798 [Friedmanniomyces simplex]
MTSNDTPSSLYGLQKPRKLAGGKAISSSTTLSFTSQLSSLINSAPPSSKTSAPSRSKPRKDDLFSTHNRNTAKRAKRDLDDSPAFEQEHTTNGDALENGVWERSKRKMEEKARLYAAMKRGDVEDMNERYAVDFDKKWAERGEEEDDEEVDDLGDSDDDSAAQQPQQQVEYTDEFGRTRTGTAAEAARAERTKRGQADTTSDRFTARPSAPANVIYGDTIQHHAFDPDSLPIAAQMEALARKRDKSLTPPPEEHFDSHKEIRTKGTAFMQFSADGEERKRQMENLALEREETERRRREREGKVEGRKAQIAARRAEIERRKGKRKAEEFLDQLGQEMGGKAEGGGERRVDGLEAGVQKEADAT